MNLQREETLEVGILLVGVGEVCTFFTIQVGFNVVALTFDHDGIPAIPLEETVTLLGEFILHFGCSLLVGIQPSTPRFVENAGGPSAFSILEVVVFALVSGHTAIWFPILLEAAEHAARVARLVDELELEGENKVAIFFFGAQEGVALDFLSESTDCSVLHFVARRATNFLPTGEVLAIKEGLESGLFERNCVRLGWKTGGKRRRFLFSFPVMITEGRNREEESE